MAWIEFSDAESRSLAKQACRVCFSNRKRYSSSRKRAPHLQEAVDQLVEEDEQLQARIESLEVQKTENEDKLKRKQAERERMEQRLMQMKSISAPYQDEVDSVFQELQAVNVMYLAKFRTLDYLEEELGKIRKCGAAR